MTGSAHSLQSQLSSKLKPYLTSLDTYTSSAREQAFTILFGFFCVYFIYNLCFVNETSRLSNETTGWAAFISALFAFLSFLTISQKKSKVVKQAEVVLKENRKYAQDKELLNLQLKESLRREMV